MRERFILVIRFCLILKINVKGFVSNVFGGLVIKSEYVNLCILLMKNNDL